MAALIVGNGVLSAAGAAAAPNGSLVDQIWAAERRTLALERIGVDMCCADSSSVRGIAYRRCAA
ncbi:hypothetical protein [Bradyrhizobium oligotrophicum]|uniref:hypothetical protein n=1 Tax=Bradyrhizobium oligotrophicum TaxID=44255 RepID=UPI003EC0D153